MFSFLIFHPITTAFFKHFGCFAQGLFLTYNCSFVICYYFVVLINFLEFAKVFFL